jgi:hypothetical protein
MEHAGAILYLLLAAIFLLFWRKSRGKSLPDLLKQEAQTHHITQKVMAKHPYGGTWRQFRQWSADEEQQSK